MPKKRKTKADLEAELAAEQSEKKRAKSELAAAEESKKKQKSAISGVAKEFVCPISLDLPIEPVTASDGRVYNRADIQRHIDTAKAEKKPILSPVTKEKLTEKLLPAIQVTNTIRTLIESGAVDGELANQWKKVDELRVGAQKGDSDRMVQLGECYYSGEEGFVKDEKKAYAWYEKAASLGNLDGIASKGTCYLYGYGVAKNKLHGIALLASSAERGSAIAAVNLGEFYYEGKYSMPKDFGLAKYWLEIAKGNDARSKWKMDSKNIEDIDDMLSKINKK